MFCQALRNISLVLPGDVASHRGNVTHYRNARIPVKHLDSGNSNTGDVESNTVEDNLFTHTNRTTLDHNARVNINDIRVYPHNIEKFDVQQLVDAPVGVLANNANFHKTTSRNLSNEHNTTTERAAINKQLSVDDRYRQNCPNERSQQTYTLKRHY